MPVQGQVKRSKVKIQDNNGDITHEQETGYIGYIAKLECPEL